MFKSSNRDNPNSAISPIKTGVQDFRSFFKLLAGANTKRPIIGILTDLFRVNTLAKKPDMIHSEASLGFLRILTPYSNLRGRPTHPDTGSNDSLPQNFLCQRIYRCVYILNTLQA